MQKIKMYQVDAFADKLFSGNPAAVCILDKWIDGEIMQQIAAENNLAETAFVVRKVNKLDIRWFSPTVEIDLCGHATLAAAYIIFELLNYTEEKIEFYSSRSGDLFVSKSDDCLFLDFPTDNIGKLETVDEFSKILGIIPLEVYKGNYDYIAILENEEEVRNLYPDFEKIAKLQARGLIVTAKGKEVDFVSRFFAPQSGINEDPVTGSAHTSLIPIWSNKLGKTKLLAKQLSKRGGELICEDRGERCLIGGKARLFFAGEIYLD